MSFNLFKKNKPDKENKNKTDTTELSKPEISNQQLTTSFGDVSLILRGAHVTEKAGNLNSLNQYVFKVSTQSNKIEIKKAVEKMYGVKVARVMISVVPAKKRRLGRQEGEKAGFKKAIVKLVAGQKIDIMPK